MGWIWEDLGWMGLTRFGASSMVRNRRRSRVGARVPDQARGVCLAAGNTSFPSLALAVYCYIHKWRL